MANAQRVAAVVLRVVTAAAAGVAAVVMGTSHETTNLFVFGAQLEARFQYTPSLVFFVAANAVACVYNLLVLVVPPASPAARFVLMADVTVGMVLTGAIAAAGTISDLGKNGNSHAAWLPICGQVETFCDHVRGALISGFVAVVLCFLTLMYSIYTVTRTSVVMRPQLQFALLLPAGDLLPLHDNTMQRLISVASAGFCCMRQHSETLQRSSVYSKNISVVFPPKL
ncbi:hypothetical protein EJB05_32801 [Eragrostis curvula]|uniref:CASP-like protein n=1 Tax=Eragrostis curvula TaxID=38414 RepID=A0A5J9UHS4_9POAL|nr:hypothetical protein EJB05_32801 [Eragrostis curvula]